MYGSTLASLAIVGVFSVYIYIYIYVCVCVCMHQREQLERVQQICPVFRVNTFFHTRTLYNVLYTDKAHYIH